MTLYTQQSRNVWKTWLLMTTFLIIIIGLGWSFSAVYNNTAILYGAVIFSIVMNVIGYWYSDKIVLSMSGARPVTREQAPDLWNVVENLAITAGLPMPKVYIINDPAPNAFATGRDKEHAVVAVTTGLLEILDRSELEGVIAHELAHIGNRDMLISTVVVILVGFITLLSDFFLRMSMFGGRDRDSRAQGIALIAGLVLAVLSPLVAVLIQLAVSRKREFLADATGALLTRYPDGLANALVKISQHGRQMKKANHATAHLFIANPFGPGKVSGFLNNLFSTHPRVEDRVAALLGKR